jgi:cbb3-type cytochrome oxidase cytochrome c subunit
MLVLVGCGAVPAASPAPGPSVLSVSGASSPSASAAKASPAPAKADEVWPERAPAPKPSIAEDSTPLTPLEQAGKAVFAREKCDGCHSLKPEPFPVPGEEPWRSNPKHAPSLASEAGKFPNIWHLIHLTEPRSVSVGSTMPTFSHLLQKRSVALRDPAQAEHILADLAQANLSVQKVNGRFSANGKPLPENSEIVAVIAYLQRLGRQVVTASAGERSPQPELAKRLQEHAKDAAALTRGENLFRANCTPCHGAQGQGLIGPRLAGASALRDKGILSTFDVIADGNPARGMPGWLPVLGVEAVRDLSAFVHEGLFPWSSTPPIAPEDGTLKP